MAANEELNLDAIAMYEVDFDSLQAATSEDDFLLASFELLKEAGIY